MLDGELAGQALRFAEALAVGVALGLWYDLLRVGRERFTARVVVLLLDLLFWLCATAALFLFAILRGDGRVRLYQGAAFLLGGGAYFLALSRAALWGMRKIADGIGFLRRMLLLPIARGGRAAKKFLKNRKKGFQNWLSWYKIYVLHDPDNNEGGADRRVQDKTGWFGHKVRHFGDSGRNRDGVSVPERPPERRRGKAGRPGPAGADPAGGKRRSGKRHRKPRRPGASD